MDFFDINKPQKEDEPKPKLDAIEKASNAHDLLTAAAAEMGVVIPAEKAVVLRQFLKTAKYGHQAALAMKCRGHGCAFYDICPLKQIEVELPIGKQCPVEGALIQQWVNQFVDSLSIDPDDPTSAVEMHMIYELAGLELIRRRAAHELSEKPELVSREIVGYSPHGEAIYDDKPSQALLILERQSKIVNKLRDSLLATPKAQSQAGQSSRDLSTRTANIMEKALEIQKMRQKGKSIQDAEFEVKQDEETEEQKQGEGPDSTE